MNNLVVTKYEDRFVCDSRQVAEVIGKNHKELLRDVRNYDQILTGANVRSLDFFIPVNYKDTKGELRPMYFLTRRGCDMVANKMTGEKGVLFTAAYVTKFEEMEKQLAQPYKIPGTFAEALRLAADQAEQIQIMAPKASYFDELVDRKNSLCFRDTAKELQVPERELIDRLVAKRYLYRDSKGRLRPFATYVPELFEEKEFVNHRNGHTGAQTIVTVKGREKFLRMFKESEACV